MTTQPTTPKRWRPRFSLRTLVILVTLVCCYAACWGPTKRQGVADVTDRIEGEFYYSPPLNIAGKQDMRARSSVVVPFVVQHEYLNGTRENYFWFFGYVARLSYEQEVEYQSSSEPVEELLKLYDY